MSVSDRIGGAGKADVELAALDITVGEVAARRLQPLPKPEGSRFGYLHGQHGGPVSCSLMELTDACRSGQAVLVWTPDTPEMVAPERVPQLAAAIVDGDLRDARSQRNGALVVLGVVAVLALVLPYAWVFLPLAAGIAGILHWRVTALQSRTVDDLIWRVPGEEPATADPLPAHGSYTLAICAALAAVGLAQLAVLGPGWGEGDWRPDRVDEGWAGVLGGPLLHQSLFALAISWMVLRWLASTLEKEAPHAFVPLAFGAGALAVAAADLVLPGIAPMGAAGGLIGIAGFYAMLVGRHAAPDRPSLREWLTKLRIRVTAAAFVLALQLVFSPLLGAGLLAGMVLGAACIPRPEKLAQEDARSDEGWAEWLGFGALGLIWLSALAAIASLLIG